MKKIACGKALGGFRFCKHLRPFGKRLANKFGRRVAAQIIKASN